MIIDFSVSNFLSIKEEQTLSLSATKIKEHPGHIIDYSDGKEISLLKSAVIYGANASGKSNILEAINQFFKIILLSHKLDIKQVIPSYRPHKLDKLWLDKSTKFEMEFIALDNIIYKYSIEISRYEIEREELIFYPKGQESLLFLRMKNKKIKFGSYLKGRKKSIEEELLSNQLFLTKAAYSNQKQLYNIYLFFLANNNFIERDDDTDMFSSHKTSKAICDEENKTFKEKINIFLSAVDTGIKSVEVNRKDSEIEESFFPPDMPEVFRRKVKDEFSFEAKTIHQLYKGKEKIGETSFKLSEESFGTRKLYSLASYIIESLEMGTLLIIDEIDNSLHPHITSLIIKLFNDPKTNKNNAQLITASHDSSLLNPKLVRRDQIWFTDKKINGSTQLYSLVEFDKNEVRAQTPFSNWYLSGRFDAIPVIDKRLFEIFDNSCANLTEENA